MTGSRENLQFPANTALAEREVTPSGEHN